MIPDFRLHHEDGDPSEILYSRHKDRYESEKQNALEAADEIEQLLTGVAEIEESETTASDLSSVVFNKALIAETQNVRAASESSLKILSSLIVQS